MPVARYSACEIAWHSSGNMRSSACCRYLARVPFYFEVFHIHGTYRRYRGANTTVLIGVVMFSLQRPEQAMVTGAFPSSLPVRACVFFRRA